MDTIKDGEMKSMIVQNMHKKRGSFALRRGDNFGEDTDFDSSAFYKRDIPRDELEKLFITSTFEAMLVEELESLEDAKRALEVRYKMVEPLVEAMNKFEDSPSIEDIALLSMTLNRTTKTKGGMCALL